MNLTVRTRSIDNVRPLIVYADRRFRQATTRTPNEIQRAIITIERINEHSKRCSIRMERRCGGVIVVRSAADSVIPAIDETVRRAIRSLRRQRATTSKSRQRPPRQSAR